MAKAAKSAKIEKETIMPTNPAPLHPDLHALLKRLSDATASGGFLYLAATEYQPLVALGFALVKPDLIEPDTGKLAARTTETGTAFAATYIAPNFTTEKEKTVTIHNEPNKLHIAPVNMAFEIEEVEIVRTRTPRAGARVWPFEQLKVGQSFHIAPTEKVPEPHKIYTSIVSNANKAQEPKHFSIIRVNASDPKGPGARVVRFEDFTAAELAAREAASIKRAAEVAAREAAMTPAERAERDAERAAKKAERAAAKVAE